MFSTDYSPYLHIYFYFTNAFFFSFLLSLRYSFCAEKSMKKIRSTTDNGKQMSTNWKSYGRNSKLTSTWWSNQWRTRLEWTVVRMDLQAGHRHHVQVQFEFAFRQRAHIAWAAEDEGMNVLNWTLSTSLPLTHMLTPTQTQDTQTHVIELTLEYTENGQK